MKSGPGVWMVGGCLLFQSCVSMSFNGCGSPPSASVSLVAPGGSRSRPSRCVFAAAGPTQGLAEGVRHEEAQQVRDDQAVGLRVLLGGAAHHGLLRQPLDRPGCTSHTSAHGF